MAKCGWGLLAAALLAGMTTLAVAGESEEPPAPDPARPAIGEWIGEVSWNDPIVAYAWQINPDGAFNSGRLGRGYSGGGAWGANGARVTLKYDDGFRYEGELRGNSYNGTAYLANGRAFGAFSMRRSMKRADGAPARPTASDD